MILVSGGSGLVGSHLLRRLSKGDRAVRALYRSDESISKCKKVFEVYGDLDYFDKIDWFKADILDIPALEKAYEGVRQVYHSAAVVSFKGKDQSKLYEVNIQGTANMVNLALKSEIDKFCFVSSVASIGKYRDGSCSDEEALWQKDSSTSDYSVSKFYAENEVWRASAEGLKTVIVNPSTIIGYGDWNTSSNKLFKKINEGMPFYPPGSNGFVVVDDVVDSMIELMNSEIENERFIISGENLSYQELFTFLANGLSKKPPPYQLSKWMALTFMSIERIISFLGVKRSRVTRANIRTAFSHKCFKTDKLRSTLGMEFRKVEEAALECGKLYKELS